ncbi:MAG TPA: glycine betaine ABC transporter substrate-binding protein [Burkholderiales bacterium]|nr:glycine betaine ABC transporter substrate-binding protein [Burkholderiales bacterium]
MRVILLGLCLLCAAGSTPAQQTLVVGSKRFTESYILGEIAVQTAHMAGASAEHRQGLGNTGIVFAALKSGSIDLYPDYTGTVARELLKSEASDLESLNRGLRPQGLGVAVPFGFEDTYALAMLDSEAQRLGVRTIGDLAAQAQLRFGLSHEFLNRSDGWPGLARVYGLPQQPRGLDHGLAYEALAASQIDVMDIYSTDAKIAKYKLRVLRDDRRFFPDYGAVLVYRLDVPQRFPRAWTALQNLQGRISAEAMVTMNAQAELEGRSFGDIAAGFLASGASKRANGEGRTGFWLLLFGNDFWRLTGQHLLLVFASLAAAVVVGIPLGVWAVRAPAAAQPILSAVGLIQTVPSLALLAFLIPLLGMIGTWPALVALFLYSLLPIVRNTHSGLADIAPPLRESAQALGLPWKARLRLVELPLAARSILAGVKTSAVINVGTATIAAFIGAGGYGERIATGLALNDNAMLLAGAVPAAALALLVHALFELFDRQLIPAGLR